jgi:hypothetical protein
LETKVEAFWRRKVGPNVMTRAFTAFNKGPAGLETVAEAVESPNMTTRRSSFMDVDALDRKMGLAAQTDRAVSTMQLSPDMLAAAAENEPFAHGNTADAPGSVMFTSLCESNCAVVVPRLLLPYIFRKRRSQLGSVREIYRRYLETVTSRKDADKRRGDAKDAQTGLYDMLIRHLQSTAVHSSTQDWLRNRSIELAEYCNDLADIFSCAGSGVPFKSSMLKKDKATRFTATNLHVETFAVMPMVTSLDDEEDENGGLVKAPCEKLLRMAKVRWVTVAFVCSRCCNGETVAPDASSLQYRDSWCTCCASHEVQGRFGHWFHVQQTVDAATFGGGLAILKQGCPLGF